MQNEATENGSTRLIIISVDAQILSLGSLLRIAVVLLSLSIQERSCRNVVRLRRDALGLFLKGAANEVIHALARANNSENKMVTV